MSSGMAPVGARSTSREAVEKGLEKGLEKGSDSRVESDAHPPRRAMAAPAKAIFTALR
jgi:hypothetical protein